MLSLTTLGGLSISAGDSRLNGSAARRRSLALLALAASAGETGISDERALALLWPDSDSAHARNNLKQLVFTLRQALGHDVFVRTPTTLRLDPSAITVDRWDFERAVAAGDAEMAVRLYSGPFLAGFHINGLPELERWVESGRERLAQAYRTALTTLACAADAAGDHIGAAGWWRKLVTEDPLNDVHAQNLIRALASSGDTAGALRQARVHEALLAQELDLEPSPDFQRVVQEVRAGTPPAPVPALSRLSTPTYADGAIAMAVAVPPAPPMPHPSGRVRHALGMDPGLAANGTLDGLAPVVPREGRILAPGLADNSRRKWRTAERRIAGYTTRFTLAAMALVVVTTVGAIAVRRSGPPATAASSSDNNVVVFPFTVNTGKGATNTGSVVAELLAASLDGSLGLRALAVDEPGQASDSVRGNESAANRRARANRTATSLGANLYLSGDVFENGEQLRITAELRHREENASVAGARVEGTRGELFDLVDRLASQLLASRIGGGRSDVVRVASVTTSSLAAAKAYFKAEAALAAGGFREAIDSYEEAIALDQSFALAHYGLSSAADMLGDADLVQRSANRALRYGQRLPSRQKRLLAAFGARQQGNVAMAKRLYAELTTDYPSDAEAWLGLGETLFHLNPLEGQPATDASDAFARAAALDPNNIGAHVHLARIAALEGDRDRSRAMVARARALAPEYVLARFALHVMSLGIPLDEAAGGDGSRRRAVALPISDAVSLLTQAGPNELLHFATRLATGNARAYGLHLLAIIEAGHGRITRAMALLDTCSQSNRALAIEARARLASLPFLPLESGAVEGIRNDVLAWTPPPDAAESPVDSIAHVGLHPYLRLHQLGLLALRLTDTATARAMADQLDAMTFAVPTNPAGSQLATSLRAHLAATSERERESLALLERVTTARVASSTPLEAMDRLLRAQLLETIGRDSEALGYYAQLGTRSPFEFALAWQADLGMARIHEKRGDRNLAAMHYRNVAVRLSNADSSLWSARDDAGRRAAALMR